jgi:hypothetical protein
MGERYIPIHSFNNSFALGIFKTEKEAEDAYVKFIESHKNYEELCKDCFNETGKQFCVLDNDDDIIEFRENKKIGFAVLDERDIYNFQFVRDYGSWVPSFDGENHLADLLIALQGGEQFVLDIENLATHHPVF